MADLRHLHASLAEHCASIADLFWRGARVTIIVYRPGFPEQDVLVGDGNLDDVARVIERSRPRTDMRLGTPEVSQ